MKRYVGYNAKARGLVGGSSKKRKRVTRESEDAEFNSNAEFLIPKTVEEKEFHHREKLKQELIPQSEIKMNQKKKKRLDKYIDKKLKQEERIQVLQKLQKSQSQLSTLHLQSSSTLGTGKTLSNADRNAKIEDKILRRSHKWQQTITEDSRSSEEDLNLDNESDSSVHDLYKIAKVTGSSKHSPIVVVDSDLASGAPLCANQDDPPKFPSIVKQERRKKKSQPRFKSWKTKEVDSESLPPSEEIFNSSESSNDSHGSHNDAEISSAGSDSDDDGSSHVKTKVGFKAWANQQLAVAKGYEITPASFPLAIQSRSLDFSGQSSNKPVLHSSVERKGPLGAKLDTPTTAFATSVSTAQRGSKRHFVTVRRPSEVKEARLLLPIVSEEQRIMEAILLHPVVIICGETGSGKTTQVPQFLYEAGYGSPDSDNPGMIGVTQPRRVAAMSMASRVANELSLPSTRVSYQIRYDATVSASTMIKFMTDGLLLREISADFLLNKYSVIIIDEAHERSINTDILIGVLSRIVKLREQHWQQNVKDIKPLRLVIMSATLRVSDFAGNKMLFSAPPPVINIATRQHPVTVHFSRRTSHDYVSEAVKKASKIHSRLPPGGILIFLTGQQEIQSVCNKLNERYSAKVLEMKQRKRTFSSKEPGDANKESEYGRKPLFQTFAHTDVEADDIDLMLEEQQFGDVDGTDTLESEDPDALDSEREDSLLNRDLGLDLEESATPMHVIPLYSLLPTEQQMRVFQAPPFNHRLVVVSTNVAETSLTIPGIRYVIDCGRAKERRYDKANGIQAFQVCWISKAAASQRAGRAGRTGPGHCYRLYSSALYDNYFQDHTQPEILRMPIEGVVLQMKSMHIDAVVNFPFPTPPDDITLKRAETMLTHLGALKVDAQQGVINATIGGHITDLGKAMALFPLSPRCSRMLIGGQQHGCLPYVISLAAILSAGDPFIREDNVGNEEVNTDSEGEELISHINSDALKAKESRRRKRKAFYTSQQMHGALGQFTSDLFMSLSVLGAYEYASGGTQFCTDHFVRAKAMAETHKLRAQICHIMNANFPGAETGLSNKLGPPNALQLKVLRQLIAAASIDQVAIRKSLLDKGSVAAGKQFAHSKGVEYSAMGISEDVFIHSSSILASRPPPDYVVYQDIVRGNKVWIKGLTVVNPSWLAKLGQASLCTFSKPVKNMSGKMMITPRFGPGRWELPAVPADSVT